MDLRHCRSATISALRWLLSQQSPDGSFLPLEHGMATHNKLLWALADMGQQPKAAQLCAWLRAYALDDEGDFATLARPAPYDRFHSVGNAFLACGAMRLGQFSVAYPVMGLLGSLQHPETGGFLTAGADATLDGEQDLLTTAVCGLACLHCGQLEAAEAAGRFVQRLWDLQPGEAAARLYLFTHRGMEMITEPTAEPTAAYVVETAKQEQWYHVPALAAGLLAALYEATGDEGWLETMHRYLQFLSSCAEDRYDSFRSGLVGWAAALAYELTGNANYLRTVEAVAEGLFANQLANGSWLMGAFSADLTSDVVDATAENIIALNQMMRSLATAEE